MMPTGRRAQRLRAGRHGTDRRGPGGRGIAVGACLVALVACGAPSPAPGAPVGTSPQGAPAPVAAAPTSAPTSAPARGCVETTLARLGADERAAQLVMVGVPADGLDAASRGALARGTGGIIVFNPARGGDPSTADVTGTTRDARAVARARTGVPLLVSTDQEGGKVQKLDGAGFPEMPSAAQQGRDPRALVAAARGWGAGLARVGVNVNLAPVADVVDPALGEANAPVGELDRGYGTDARTASAGVTAFVRGMGESGVSATLKHFPGLGKVRENTDFAGGVVDTATTRTDPDLESFRAGIRAGAPLVMMSSARYTRIDPDEIAVFSRPVISEVLRGSLGFRGVVMTDDVGVAEALADVPVGQRATRFLEAGGDLVLTVRPADATPMIDALVTRAGRDPAFRARVDESVRRVLALKEQRAGLTCR